VGGEYTTYTTYQSTHKVLVTLCSVFQNDLLSSEKSFSPLSTISESASLVGFPVVGSVMIQTVPAHLTTRKGNMRQEHGRLIHIECLNQHTRE
jgi:hypothetical protein